MRVLVILCLGLLSPSVFAKNLIRVKAIGASPKGQYVAFEEFGFENDSKSPFSKIRVMNVWKNKYVTETIFVTDPNNEMQLDQIRAKAKQIAAEKLKAFDIST